MLEQMLQRVSSECTHVDKIVNALDDHDSCLIARCLQLKALHRSCWELRMSYSLLPVVLGYPIQVTCMGAARHARMFRLHVPAQKESLEGVEGVKGGGETDIHTERNEDRESERQTCM